MDLEKEIPKHKKKKKSSTSKAKNKSKHKHEYEEVLFIVPSFSGGTSPARGTRCKICGKIGNVSLWETVHVENPNSKFGLYRTLSDEEVYEKFKDLEQVPLDSYWQQFAPVERG